MCSATYSAHLETSSATNFIIETRDLWHVYDGDVNALQGANVQIPPGGVVAIVGPNGSGKTTLIKHFNGLLKPTQGTVLINGMDTRRTRTSKLARVIGFVFQNPDHQIFASTVMEETIFGLKQMRVELKDAQQRAEGALEAVGLYEMRNRHPRQLSRGQRQRLATASVLALETPVLVLDEPTTGQDFEARRQIMSLVMDLNIQGRTVLMVTHDMSLVAEYAARVILMKAGKVILDTTPKEMFSRADLLSRAGLKVPAVVEIGMGLGNFDKTAIALTLEELYELIVSNLPTDKALSEVDR